MKAIILLPNATDIEETSEQGRTLTMDEREN